MTTVIRRWQDSDFYLSSAGTANVREQIIKLQSIGKLVRALSDASTVDTNGDKLQDRLLGLSLGDLNQRHKWRVLYDNLNDLFLVQRNTGTDAAKVWSERFRIDATGNVTTTGSLSATAVTVRNVAGLVLGGDLDVNDFYIRSAADIQTQTLRVTQQLTLPNNHTVGRVYITSKTASNSPLIDFAGLTQYPRYEIDIEHMVPSVDNAIPLAAVSINNGASFLSSAIYASAGVAYSNFPSTEAVSSSGAAAWNIIGDGGVNQDNAATSGITGTLRFTSMGSTTVQCRARAQLEWIETNGTFNITSDIGLFATAGNTVNAIRFQYLTGAITSGTFRLYGIRNT